MTTIPTITKTPTPTPKLSPTSPPGQATYPAQVLNLINWKETLPIGPVESPTEIKQPQLATYKIEPWFVTTTDNNGSGVRFRAPVNGVSTGGSHYIRSELREMKNNGTANADWSSNSQEVWTILIPVL